MSQHDESDRAWVLSAPLFDCWVSILFKQARRVSKTLFIIQQRRRRARHSLIPWRTHRARTGTNNNHLTVHSRWVNFAQEKQEGFVQNRQWLFNPAQTNEWKRKIAGENKHGSWFSLIKKCFYGFDSSILFVGNLFYKARSISSVVIGLEVHCACVVDLENYTAHALCNTNYIICLLSLSHA